jgi:aconitate hydratase
MLVHGPNIQPLPDFDPLPDTLELTVLLKVGDDISTDTILPAGAEVLPLRSNIPRISRYLFRPLDARFHDRAMQRREQGSALVAGTNYGQGSSREHAALAPRYLNVRMVLAIGFARIHWQNLANFGILPLRFAEPRDLQGIEAGDRLVLRHLRHSLKESRELLIENRSRGSRIRVIHDLSPRLVQAVMVGGLLPLIVVSRRKRWG